jgi:hypothetical protein
MVVPIKRLSPWAKITEGVQSQLVIGLRHFVFASHVEKQLLA